MKAILMSIQSEWLREILNGRKTAELRKRFPKDYRGWVYLYCTKAKPYLADFGDYEYPYKSGGIICTYDMKSIIGHDAVVFNGKVAGRVWVDNVDVGTKLSDGSGYVYLPQKSLWLTNEEIMQYANNSPTLTVIYFSKLEIFDEPKELNDFSVDHSAKWRMPIKAPIIKAPQSWQYIYIEEDK